MGVDKGFGVISKKVSVPKAPSKPPIPKKTAAPTVRDGIIRGSAPPALRPAYTNPFSLINPRIATQLRTAGVTVRPYTVNEMRWRTGVTPASFDAGANAIRYNPTAGGWQGSLQHEFTHAAASNIHPLRLGSLDPRLAAQYIVGQQTRNPYVRGTTIPTPNTLALAGAAFVMPNTFNSMMRQGGGYERAAEGLADRSGAYDYRSWGERIRRRIVPNPLDANYIYRR